MDTISIKGVAAYLLIAIDSTSINVMVTWDDAQWDAAELSLRSRADIAEKRSCEVVLLLKRALCGITVNQVTRKNDQRRFSVAFGSGLDIVKQWIEYARGVVFRTRFSDVGVGQVQNGKSA